MVKLSGSIQIDFKASSQSFMDGKKKKKMILLEKIFSFTLEVECRRNGVITSTKEVMYPPVLVCRVNSSLNLVYEPRMNPLKFESYVFTLGLVEGGEWEESPVAACPASESDTSQNLQSSFCTEHPVCVEIGRRDWAAYKSYIGLFLAVVTTLLCERDFCQV